MRSAAQMARISGSSFDGLSETLRYMACKSHGSGRGTGNKKMIAFARHSGCLLVSWLIDVSSA